MPTTTTYIGTQAYPLPTGGLDSPLRSPLVDGLLGYFGHWISTALSPKLAEMRGPVSSEAVTDACPAENRFPWNHNGTFMRQVGTPLRTPLPALYIWLVSTGTSPYYTTLWYNTQRKRLTLQWIFHELSVPDGYAARSGLTEAVADAVWQGVDKGRHPNYLGGQPIHEILNISGIELDSGQWGNLSQRPTDSAAGRAGAAGSEGAKQKFFPTYIAQLSVFAKTGDWEADPSADTNQDIPFDIHISGDNADEEDFDPQFSRILVAPDSD